MSPRPTPTPPRRREIRNVLIIAVVLSVLLHLVAGALFSRYRPQHADEKEAVQRVTLTTVVHLRPPTPPPTPTPPPPTPTPPVKTPPPKPTATPPPTTPKPATPPPTQAPPVATAAPTSKPVAHLHLNVPKAATHSANAPSEAHADAAPGTQNGTVGGHGTQGGGEPGTTGAPSPPPPAPTKPPSCGQPDREATPIDKVQPETPEEADGAVGTAQIQVSINASGEVVSASVYKSTGNPFLDKAAVQAAQQSTFRTARRNCVDVAGSYLYRVEFAAQ